jgi:hypothetical protein
MKREMIRNTVLGLVAGLLMTGCYHERVVVRERAVVSPGAEVVVTEAPPPPRREVIGTAPTARHEWVEGYWVYKNGRYVWISGHWELRPRERAVWVPGHWDHTPRGWVWRPGHWD